MDSPFRRLASFLKGAHDGKPERLRWQVPDLIDFDYYVAEDEQRIRERPAERKRLAERDRRLYKEQIAPIVGDAGTHTTTHRSRALRWWLELRRRQEDANLAELLPGTAFERGQRLVTYAMGILGFALGIGVASALLDYDGQHPVNVSWYVFWLVLLQLLLAGTTLTLWYGRRSRIVRGAAQDVSLLGHLVRPLFSRVARWIQQQRLAHVSPDLREQAQARKGLLQSHYALYGPASYLPMLIPAQVFGIGFNLGAILITITLEWFTDLAFGWGSALNIGPGAVHGLTQFIALPWSWLFGEGVGFPTLEQVAGTRISLKDPLFVLDAEHLRSWRWFLVLAVFTYGLLPRLLLLGLSARKQRRALDALPFTHQSAQAPYARMITPSLAIGSARTGIGPEMPIPAPLKPLTGPTAAPRPAGTVKLADAPNPPQTPPKRAEDSAAKSPTSQQPTPGTPAQESANRAPAKGVPANKQRPKKTPSAEPAPSPEPPLQAEPKAPVSTGPTATEDQEDQKAAAETKGEQATPALTPPPAEAQAAAPQSAPAPETATEQPEQPVSAATTPTITVEADACILLLHLDVADLLEESDHTRLQQLLRWQAGWQVAVAATFGGGRAMSEQALSLIEGAHWQAPPPRVALIQDGSQPPITENLRFLRAVRAATGEHAQILLALIGDPDDDEHDRLPPLSDFDFTDWQCKIEQLGDPYLRLITLADAETEQP